MIRHLHQCDYCAKQVDVNPLLHTQFGDEPPTGWYLFVQVPEQEGVKADVKHFCSMGCAWRGVVRMRPTDDGETSDHA